MVPSKLVMSILRGPQSKSDVHTEQKIDSAVYNICNWQHQPLLAPTEKEKCAKAFAEEYLHVSVRYILYGVTLVLD